MTIFFAGAGAAGEAGQAAGLCAPGRLSEGAYRIRYGQVFPTATALKNRRELAEGETVDIGSLSFRVLHTPGHTPGSVSLLAGDVLFTGDTLFCGSIGRTDFAGGDDALMRQSLARLKALDGDYRVYPGHEGETTLERERRSNPYLLEIDS